MITIRNTTIFIIQIIHKIIFNLHVLHINISSILLICKITVSYFIFQKVN